jgi:hypothetical protein
MRVAFQLDRRDGDGWSNALLADVGRQLRPAGVGAGGQRGIWAWETAGWAEQVRTTSGSRITPRQGAYRICTANADDEFCASIEITDEK